MSQSGPVARRVGPDQGFGRVPNQDLRSLPGVVQGRWLQFGRGEHRVRLSPDGEERPVETRELRWILPGARAGLGWAGSWTWRRFRSLPRSGHLLESARVLSAGKAEVPGAQASWSLVQALRCRERRTAELKAVRILYYLREELYLTFRSGMHFKLIL